MADRAVRGAQERLARIDERLAELRREIDGLQRERSRIDAFIKQWHFFADDGGASSGAALRDLDRAARSSSPLRPKNSRKEEVAAVARDEIEKEGRPLTRSELYERLVARGLTIEGADPERVLHTMLWRMQDRVVRLPGGGYWLAERPWPGAGYFPDSAGCS